MKVIRQLNQENVNIIAMRCIDYIDILISVSENKNN